MKKKALTSLFASVLAVAPNGKALAGPDYINMSCHEIGERVNTLEDLQEVFNTAFRWTADETVYGVTNFVASADRICKNRDHGVFVDDCDAAPVLGGRFLNNNPRGLIMHYLSSEVNENGDRKQETHVVYLDRKDGKIGTAGLNPLDYRSYIFTDIESVCESFGIYYGKMVGCAEFDISRKYPDYISAKENMASAISGENFKMIIRDDR